MARLWFIAKEANNNQNLSDVSFTPYILVNSVDAGDVNSYILIQLFHIYLKLQKTNKCKNQPKCCQKKFWDKKTGLGRQKIFEVRKLHNDVTFIDSFMNEEFCHRLKLFTYGFNRRTGQYEIVDRDWRKVKNQLLFSLTNFGNPIICVEDANFENRAELLLTHRHEGVDLEFDKASETLRNIQLLWKRPVHIITKYNNQAKLLTHDGKELKEKDV